jgi:hypothetical protein
VEIEPIGRPGAPRSTWRTVLTAAAPVLVLVLVASAAIAGARLEAPPIATTPAPSPSLAVTAPPAAAAAAIDFPVRVLGLRVRSVTATLDLRRSGAISDEIVAVRGFMTVRPDPVACFRRPPVTARVETVACQRDTILADTPVWLLEGRDGVVAWAGERGVAHLHPQAFPGTSLVPLEPPAAVVDTVVEDGPILPSPVVLVGRFGDPRLTDPRAGGRHADTGFTVERVVWSGGARQAVPLVAFVPVSTDDLPLQAVRSAISGAVSSGTVALNHVLLDLETLRAIDPDAAGQARRALEGSGAESGRLWYVRVLTRAGNPVDTLAGDTIPRRIGWVVLDAEGEVLAARTER